MITSKLTRTLDAGEERRLREAWADLEVFLTTIRERFRLSPDDTDKLRDELGVRVTGGPSSPSAKNQAKRRERLLASSIRRVR